MPTLKEVVQVLFLIILGAAFLGFGLSACEYEHELQEVKNKQWVNDAQTGMPFTQYNEE